MLHADQIEAPRRDSAAAPARTRGVLFVSHAAPDNNDFAKWLATQLAISGYQVWCDVTKLLGGEAFWSDISEAIDAHAFRFLFVSTLEANRKPGTLRELKLALEAQGKYGLKDFIVPLKIDEFPFASMQKPLGDLNCVRFDENWAAGLKQLLDLLEREGAPKSALAGPACVADWYERTRDPRRKVVVSNSLCHSNWFRLRLPEYAYAHRFSGPAEALRAVALGLRLPHRVHGTYLVTFAPLADIQAQLGPDAIFGTPISFAPKDFMERGDASFEIAADDAFRIVSDLVRQAWDAAMDARGLQRFMLSGDLAARFFANGELEKNRGYLATPPGVRRRYRQLVGRKSKRTLDGQKVPDGFWHYALSASVQLLPFPRLALRNHVLFTDDGVTPWSEPDRMVKARRSVCKNWWNAEWRDRLFAFTAALGPGGEQMLLPVGGNASIALTLKPMSFTSPWTFYEGKDPALDEAAEIELIEELDEEDDEEPGNETR